MSKGPSPNQKQPAVVGDRPTSGSANRTLEWSVVLVALVLPTIITYFYFVVFADGDPGQQYAVYSIGKSVQFSLPLAWMAYAARDRIGLSRLMSSGWGLSLAMSLSIFAATVLLYHFVLRDEVWFASTIGEVQAKVSSIRCDELVPYMAMACFYSLIHSLLEEYYWRWFVFDRLRYLTSVNAAIVVSSLGFMAHHVIVLAKYFHGLSPLTVLLSLCIAVGGAFWAWLYNRTGSLWPSWLGHAIVDAAIFWVGYQMVCAS